MDDFDIFYKKLLNFYKVYKHTYVYPGWTVDVPLTKWVENIRSGQFFLTADQKGLLQSLDFNFDEQDAEWMNIFYALKEYIEEYGLQSVYDNKDKCTQKLHTWITEQKDSLVKGNLNHQQIEFLTFISLDDKKYVAGTGLRKAQWEKKYAQLKKIYQKHGTLETLYNTHNENLIPLYKWAISQISNEKNLLPEYKYKLNELDFQWEADLNKRNSLWNNNFNELVAFKDKFGDLNVNYKKKEYRRLYKWIITQRYREKMLSEDRKQKLLSIGFSFMNDLDNEKKEKWNSFYKKLKTFYTKNGHLKIPYNKNKKLYQWVRYMKTKKGHIPEDQERKLLKIGFEFND